MKSIRTYLLLALLAIITLVTFLSLLHGYQSSIAKAQILFDERLLNMAEVIAIANQDTEPRHKITTEYSPTVFFQIWTKDQQLISHSDNAPQTDVTAFSQSNYYKDVNFNGYRWRLFSLKDHALDRWIVTGERVDIRYTLAENVVLASIIPIVLAIPLAGIIIWWAIALGLRPLRVLTQQLDNKQADDLSPILMDKIPDELSSLVNTTNALFERLNAAFLREQQFSADAAHELRTPISALKLQAYNLENNSNINDLQIKPLVKGIDRMGLVIEQILSLYRHSPDQAMLQLAQSNLYAISQHVIVTEYDQIAAKQQTISLHGDEQSTILGNEFALETLLQNLITNARKYTPEKSEIRVTVQQKETTICLVVEDSGTGIPVAEYDRVFKRFYRVDGDQHDSGIIGCGLGLAIVQHIANIHNARISLGQSEQLGGLKVTVEFPIVNNS